MTDTRKRVLAEIKKARQNGFDFGNVNMRSVEILVEIELKRIDKLKNEQEK